MEGNSFGGCGLLWRIIPFSILWSIWKERNERIFGGKVSSWEGLITFVSLRVVKWASMRKECSDLKIDDVLHN